MYNKGNCYVVLNSIWLPWFGKCVTGLCHTDQNTGSVKIYKNIFWWLLHTYFSICETLVTGSFFGGFSLLWVSTNSPVRNKIHTTGCPPSIPYVELERLYQVFKSFEPNFKNFVIKLLIITYYGNIFLDYTDRKLGGWRSNCLLILYQKQQKTLGNFVLGSTGKLVIISWTLKT